MKYNTPLITLLLFIILLSSCASIFNGVVLPNQCKKCAVIDTMTGDTLDVFEGCGGDNTRLEESAKISAFEEMKWSNNCNIDVYCYTWRKSPDEE